MVAETGTTHLDKNLSESVTLDDVSCLKGDKITGEVMDMGNLALGCHESSSALPSNSANEGINTPKAWAKTTNSKGRSKRKAAALGYSSSAYCERDPSSPPPRSPASTSRRRPGKGAATTVNNALYVGYVEDGESVEAIMKKFEELDRLKSTRSANLAGTQAGASEGAPANIMDSSSYPAVNSSYIMEGNLTVPSLNSIEPDLSQEELEELFKRTSSFSVKTLSLDMDNDEELEWLLAQDENFVFDEDEDYTYYDGFWDEEDEWAGQTGNSRKRGTGEPKAPRSRRTGNDREALLARYKVLNVQVVDRHGNYFMRKKICPINPDIPTYVRIPPLPLPRSWAKNFTSKKYPSKALNETPYVVYPDSESTVISTSDILSYDLHTLGNQFQAIYMDPPLILPHEAGDETLDMTGKISIEQFASLNIGDLIPCGFLFIWVEKELTLRVLRAAEAWGFRYVENFSWIKKEVNNKIATRPYAFFNKSKSTCLIFRKEGHVDLRHQRSPDCEFDFIRPDRPNSKPEFIYSVIETLLPDAVQSATNPKGNRLLELWSSSDITRPGWIRIAVERQPSQV